jgi:hypothetical protein
MPAAREGPQVWHERLRMVDKSNLSLRGEAVSYGRGCKDRTLWQVPFDMDLPDKSTKRIHFLVRWTSPYRFAMVGVSETAREDCTRADPGGEERRLLTDTPGRRYEN